MVGTYSSVFIATPVVVDLTHRKDNPAKAVSDSRPVAAATS